MGSFKDNKNRLWEINVNVASCKRVKSLLDVDLLDLATTPQRLISDPIFLSDVLYCVCKPYADTLGVSDEEFGIVLSGNIIGEARNALIQGIENFFPSPEEREAAKVAIQKAKEFQILLRQKAVREMNAEDQNELADKLIQRIKAETAIALAKMFGEPSTD